MAVREGHGTEAVLHASEALLTQIWAKESDIGDGTVVASALADAGLPGNTLVDEANNNTDVLQRLVAKDAQAAIDANIFGSDFVVDGQVFCGQTGGICGLVYRTSGKRCCRRKPRQGISREGLL